MYKVIIIDDDSLALSTIREFLTLTYTSAVSIDTFVNSLEALAHYQAAPADIVITDIRMPIMDGLELVKQMRSANHFFIPIIISAYSEFQYAKKAIPLGVTNYLLKPLDFGELKTSIDDALSKLNLHYHPQETQKIETTPFVPIDKAIYSRKSIQRAVDYMRLHYSEDLTRESVASVVYMSTSYFSKLFKEETGLSFSEYLTEIRIKQAIELLKTDAKIEKIAKAVGYTSSNRFRVNFKNYTSYSPGDYRKYILRIPF